ncbi:hypothetical protein D477_011581 [Arthrobacter crystallopoietes BAB-32]|uniref:Uncharacterized protein n=1 Tax=Arthrobacter crystallopoietes BAB-32 TaxID=1246476 RepID=N1V1U5_9MICC|nr:hypothetical protein [Arthrobacter crystallopoietes]EMY34057.1 hypothetical protein D477_011581 [Arthrobacter crystallopoietes BAB-32]
MQKIKLQYRKPIVDAVQITPSNLDAVAAWCSGRVRGTALPPEQRCVQIDTLWDGEQEAHVGDWMVSRGDGRFNRYTEDELQAVFLRAS